MGKQLSSIYKASELLKEHGKEKASQLVSEAINDLSSDGHALSNKYQLRFWVNVLFHLEVSK